MLDYSYDGIWIADRVGRILFANASCAARLGVTKESLIGKSMEGLLEDKIFSESVCLEAIEQGRYLPKASKTGRKSRPFFLSGVLEGAARWGLICKNSISMIVYKNTNAEDVTSVSIFQKKNTSIMIVEYLLEKIQNGELKKGDKLMPEREMSEMMGVSRIPLREALCALSVIGVLESRQGDGTFITTQCDSTVLGRIFYDYAVLEGVPLQQILAGRSAIEVECARAAALNSTEEDKAAIRQAAKEHREALENMDQEANGAERVEKSDLKFHRAILAAAHNRFLSMMLTMVSESFYAMYESNFKKSPGDAKNAMLLTSRTHMALADAIAAGDVKQAEELMRQHGTDVERLYLDAEVRQKGEKGHKAGA